MNNQADRSFLEFDEFDERILAAMHENILRSSPLHEHLDDPRIILDRVKKKAPKKHISFQSSDANNVEKALKRAARNGSDIPSDIEITMKSDRAAAKRNKKR